VKFLELVLLQDHSSFLLYRKNRKIFPYTTRKVSLESAIAKQSAQCDEVAFLIFALTRIL